MFDTVRNGVVVVAHSDDEVLWSGGLLARYGEKFTVICCSIPRADPVRAWKFFEACDIFGAKPRLIPFTETPVQTALDNLGLLDLSGFDCVVTHNREGEYGHHHHRTLHSFVMKQWQDKTATFGWSPERRGDIVLHLTAQEQAKKIAALRCYDHTSPRDQKPKWEALLERYSIDLRVETFHSPRS